MESRRIHNNLKIDWSITRNGVPEDFSGKQLSVRMKHAYGEEAKISYTIEANVVHVLFAAIDQKRTGIYSLVLTENEGKTDMCEAYNDYCEDSY